MVNDKNLINKLTKGFKLKINKKKKSNWKTLNSKESLPPTPSEDLMLYSDTEAELYQAKVNVLANRSYVSYSNNNNSFNNESNFNTDNILAGLNSNDNFVGRSKTTYTRPTTNTYTYNSTINNNNNNKSQSSQTQNNFLYPNNTAESRKNSFQTIIGTSPNTNSKPIPINNTSSSNNSTPYTSAPNSPLSFESSDTYVNDLKMNPNNPFISNINATSTINPKATTSQINTHLNINVNNMDPALSHSLISPIEFDGSGKEIKSSKSTSNNNIINNINNNNNNNNNKSTTMDSINNNNNTSQKEFPAKSRSIKKMKPLITFDKPPVVSPMAPESDSDEVGHRRRGGKKSKKYSKKRSSPAISLKTDMKEGSRDIGKKSTYTYGSNISSDPSSVITSKANKSLNSPTEEDDDVPLGIIQYKCLSSLLQESAPPNISSLQSNTKSYKSSHLKDSYGYISPSEYCSKENDSKIKKQSKRVIDPTHKRSFVNHSKIKPKSNASLNVNLKNLKSNYDIKVSPIIPLSPPLSPHNTTSDDDDDENDNIPLAKLMDLDANNNQMTSPVKTMVKPKNLPKLKYKKENAENATKKIIDPNAMITYNVNVNEELDFEFDTDDMENNNINDKINNNNINNINNNTINNTNIINNNNTNNINNNNTSYHITTNLTPTSPTIDINPFDTDFINSPTTNNITSSLTTSKAIDIVNSNRNRRPYYSSSSVFSDTDDGDDEEDNVNSIFQSNRVNVNPLILVNDNLLSNNNINNNNNNNNNNFFFNSNNNNFNQFNNNNNNNININNNNNSNNNYNNFNFGGNNNNRINNNPFLYYSNLNMMDPFDIRPYSL